ncbi:MAG: hypothetical protein KGZ65_03900 [Sphingomonadales bacterium]|nr:hypothetical protein [Sphingomonadaceae bacterium]MBS3930355.1 hypothetical protein [Sphingomonadales bacterium]
MKRMIVTLGLVLALPTALHAAAGEMNVATFLAKADALKAKGAMALFSSDVNLLKAEGTAAGEAYRARLAKERAAGRPSSCPPQGVKVNSNDVLAHLRAYPTSARPKVSMKQAMADFFIKKYPCR